MHVMIVGYHYTVGLLHVPAAGFCNMHYMYTVSLHVFKSSGFSFG